MKWRSCLVGDFVETGQAEIQTGPFGTQLHASDYVSDGTPVINVRNIGFADLRPDKIEFVSGDTAERLSVQLLRRDDIVFGRKGAVDRHLFVTEAQEKWMQGSDCIRLRFNADEVCPRFTSYGFLRAEHQQWMLTQAGNKATMASLNQDIIKRIPLYLPLREVQREIVSILSAYDDLIENNRRRMALLEESARLLFQEWFVRLRFPGHEHTPITNGIPKGWQRLSIAALVERDEVDLQTGPFGTQLKASDYTESGAPVINVRNIGFGELRPEKLEFVPEEVAERLQQHVLRTGDIVFGRKGAVDRHLLIRSTQEGWIQGSDCIRMRSCSSRVSTLLMSLAFRETPHKQWMITQCSNKATMASLNQEVLGRIEALLPSQLILDEFVNIATDAFRQIGNLWTQNERLRAARDLLLPRLMSGEVKV